MATHDYVIANASGSSVRADINNALAAIVSNNSNATSPSTTYAFQFWADTTTGQLKIRNAANSAWITLMELDGTMLMEDGSAASPGLSFASDLDTGLFREESNRLNFSTGGVERFRIETGEVVVNDPSNDVDFRVESNGNAHMLFVDAGNDRVGIGTSTPGSVKLEVAGSAAFRNEADLRLTIGSSGSIGSNDSNFIRAATDQVIYNSATSSGRHSFELAGSEKARIDSSGRLLIGASTATLDQTWANLQLRSADGAALVLAREDTTVTTNDDIGSIRFYANDAGSYHECAKISAEADEAFGSSSKPSSLRFFTTDTGASSPTERLRISQNGAIGIGTTSNSNRLRIHEGSDTPNVVIVTGADESSEFLALGIDSGVPCVTAGGVSSTSAQLAFRVSDSGTESEAARFDKDGRLLVGTTSSQESTSFIQNISASDSTIFIASSNTSASGQAKINLGPSNNITGAQIICVAEEDFSTGANRTARLEFHTRQNGTLAKRFSITPGGTLVAGDSTNGGPQLFVSDPSTANQRGRQLMYAKSGTSGGQEIFQIFNGSTEKLRLRADGNAYNVNNVFSSLSDVKLKENIVDAASQWDDIKGLRVRKYNFKESTGHDTHTQIGLIAQEVETVSPGLVTDLADNDADGNQTDVVTKSVNYSVLYMKAVKALQEAMARIETLETKVAALEAG